MAEKKEIDAIKAYVEAEIRYADAQCSIFCGFRKEENARESDWWAARRTAFENLESFIKLVEDDAKGEV